MWGSPKDWDSGSVQPPDGLQLVEGFLGVHPAGAGDGCAGSVLAHEGQVRITALVGARPRLFASVPHLHPGVLKPQPLQQRPLHLQPLLAPVLVHRLYARLMDV